MHVAIIMDGNGRWARERGLPRTAGHAAGARAADRIVEAAARSAIDTLTLYAFSSDNWRRPAGEVTQLMSLLERYLLAETPRCVENGVRVSMIGRRDRLDSSLVAAIERTESLTRHGSRLRLRLAVDYSSRDTILQAADSVHGGGCDRNTFAQSFDALDVDLLIRTGGERRLSDFLLWESAYAELYFVDIYWPDFDERALQEALHHFHGRSRRFGGIVPEETAQVAGGTR